MSTTAPATLTAAGQSLGYSGGMTLSLPVTNMQRSIKFYEDVVGFKLQYKLDDMGWCELTTSVPNLSIGLSQVEKPKVGEMTPTFSVKDIDAARKALEERGAKFDGETREIPDMVKLATFYDPDGNTLMLYQSLAEEFE